MAASVSTNGCATHSPQPDPGSLFLLITSGASHVISSGSWNGACSRRWRTAHIGCARRTTAANCGPGHAPGAVEHIHRHDSYACVYVLEGSIVEGVRGGKEVTLTPGQTFYEGPNDVHTVGRNASMTKPAKFVVVLVKKKGVDAVLPAE